MISAASSVPSQGPIVVCLDGSRPSESGLGIAATLGRATGQRLWLFGVLDTSQQAHPRPVDALATQVARTELEAYLHKLAGLLSASDLDVSFEAVEGNPAEQILHVAERKGADLVIVTAHGDEAGSRFHYGSTAQKVAQHAHQSVLLVRADPSAEPISQHRIERILVLLDGSPAAEIAMHRAIDLAQKSHSEIVLGHAAIRPVFPSHEPLGRNDVALCSQLMSRLVELAEAYLHHLEEDIRERGIACRSIVAPSDSVRNGVLSLAEQQDVDLIMMTSHGHTSSSRVAHGAVAQQVLTHARQPVWMIQNIHTRLDHAGSPTRRAPSPTIVRPASIER